MFEPYAFGAEINHVWSAGVLNVYVVFRFPMHIAVKPAEAVWVVNVNGVDKTPNTSAWVDSYTMLLTLNAIASFPASVQVKFAGPDPALETVWRKNWEPWGYIPSQNIGSFDQSLNKANTPTFAGLLTAGGIAGDGQDIAGLAGYDLVAPFLHLDGNAPRVVLDAAANGAVVFANRNAAVNSKLVFIIQTASALNFLVLNDDLTTKVTFFSVATSTGAITVSQAFRSNVGFNVNGVAGGSGTVPLAKLTAGGSNGSIVFSGGLMTSFAAPT